MIARLGVRIPTFAEKVDDRGRPYVGYDLVVSYGSREWSAAVRYSHVLAFHDAVRRRFPNLALAKMPPKKVLGAQKRVFLDRRRFDLEQYLQTALAYEAVRTDRPLMSLLLLSDPIADPSSPSLNPTPSSASAGASANASAASVAVPPRS